MEFPNDELIIDWVLKEYSCTFKVYRDMAGEWPMNGGCEGYIQGRIAEQLFKRLGAEKLSTRPFVSVENTYKRVAKSARGLERHSFENYDKDQNKSWGLMNAIGRSQRADIVAWEDEKPRAVIEIKLAWQPEKCITDVWRTAAALFAHGSRPNDGTLQIGITAFCVTDWNTEGKILNVVRDKIDTLWNDPNFPSEWRNALKLCSKNGPNILNGPNDDSNLYPFCVAVTGRRD